MDTTNDQTISGVSEYKFGISDKHPRHSRPHTNRGEQTDQVVQKQTSHLLKIDNIKSTNNAIDFVAMHDPLITRVLKSPQGRYLTQIMNDSVCSYTGCTRAREPNTIFCSTRHQCKFLDCRDFCFSINAESCTKHCCKFSGCQSIQTYPSSFCKDHACVYCDKQKQREQTICDKCYEPYSLYQSQLCTECKTLEVSIANLRKLEMFIRTALPALELKREELDPELKECFFCLVRTETHSGLTESIERIQQRMNVCMQKYQMRLFQSLAVDIRIEAPPSTSTLENDPNFGLDNKLTEIIRLSKASSNRKTTNIKNHRREKRMLNR